MSPLSKKVYAAAIAIAIAALAYQFYFDHFSIDSSSAESTPHEPILNIGHDDNLSKVPNINIGNDSAVITLEATFSDKSKRNDISVKCGFEPNYFYLRRTKTDISDMTEKQLNIYEKYEKICVSWYDYLNNLDDSSVELLKKEQDIWSKEMELYLTIFEETSNPKILLQAANELKNGLDEKSDFRLAGPQLIYLLHFDTDLQLKIGNELNTSSLNFIRSIEGATYATQLLLCNYSDCSPDSMLMFGMCLSNDEACGLSVQQYLQNTLTYSQFTDWQNAADVLYRLFETGWFAERDILNP